MFILCGYKSIFLISVLCFYSFNFISVAKGSCTIKQRNLVFLPGYSCLELYLSVIQAAYKKHTFNRLLEQAEINNYAPVVEIICLYALVQIQKSLPTLLFIFLLFV